MVVNNKLKRTGSRKIAQFQVISRNLPGRLEEMHTFRSPIIRLRNIRSRCFFFTANLTFYAVNLRVEKVLQIKLRSKKEITSFY
jgi:hypothetical protein